ncbi:hypothetical protein, partial [Azonexus sp.]|uniref:hypothetical protein n=1 Tax=Azonexus sp. TaxID=1872668 RepID=UPI0027B891DA
MTVYTKILTHSGLSFEDLAGGTEVTDVGHAGGAHLPTLDFVDLGAGDFGEREVLPVISATGNLVKSVFEKENGLEEAIFRRADHWFFAAG